MSAWRVLCRAVGDLGEAVGVVSLRSAVGGAAAVRVHACLQTPDVLCACCG